MPAKKITAVDIAKDVIKQIKARKITPKRRTFFIPKGKAYFRRIGQDMKSVLGMKSVKCEACGIGALFVSGVLLENNFKATDGTDLGRSAIGEYLSPHFDPQTLADIETAFEMTFVCGEYNWDALRFGQKHLDHKERLIAIMKNVIKNKGKFKPPAA